MLVGGRAGGELTVVEHHCRAIYNAGTHKVLIIFRSQGLHLQDLLRWWERRFTADALHPVTHTLTNLPLRCSLDRKT